MLRREPLSAHQVSHIYLQHGVFERPHDQNAGSVTAPRGNGPDVITGALAGAEQARAVVAREPDRSLQPGGSAPTQSMACPFRFGLQIT